MINIVKIHFLKSINKILNLNDENPVFLQQAFHVLCKFTDIIYMGKNVCRSCDISMAFSFDYLIDRTAIEEIIYSFYSILLCEARYVCCRLDSYGFDFHFLKSLQKQSIIASNVNNKGIFVQ